MLSSAEGSILYDLGGYTLPFYVNAGCLFVFIPLIIIFIPTNKEMTEI